MTQTDCDRISQADLRQKLAEADHDLMRAVVAGCAIVANADGWVVREERRRMTGMIRAIDPLAAFERDDVLKLFKEINARFAADHAAAEQHAFALVGKLRGRRLASELLITVCSAVAGADGGFDAEERQALIAMCDALEVDPAHWGLRAAA